SLRSSRPTTPLALCRGLAGRDRGDARLAYALWDLALVGAGSGDRAGIHALRCGERVAPGRRDEVRVAIVRGREQRGEALGATQGVAAREEIERGFGLAPFASQ